MSRNEISAIFECVVILVILGIAAALFVNSQALPESTREPVGPAMIPQIVSGIVILLCLALEVRAVQLVVKAREARISRGGAPQAGAPVFRHRFDLAAAVLIWAIIYVGLLQTRAIPNEFLSPLFLGGAILVLTGFKRSAILPSIAIALLIGLGTHYLFTNFFYIDLP